MKTLDEVIAELEDEELFADALNYLKEYREKRDDILQMEEALGYCEIMDNPPLTWNELKSMEGKPVWVEGVEIVIGGSIPVKDWYLIEWISDDDFEAVLRDRHGNQMIYPRNGDWQAYRKERK